MVDYSVDGDFDIYLNERNEFAVVDGRNEFEEDVVVLLHDRFGDVVGTREATDTVNQKVELLIERVAREFGIIAEISRINIYQPQDRPDTLSVEIVYGTGGTFEETL